MLLIYSDEHRWTDSTRSQCFDESVQLVKDLKENGRCLAASPLHSVTTATSVRIRDGKRLVTDGPFAETKEQLGGFYIIEAKNLDEAIEIAARVPPAKQGTVEIRPVLELPGLAEEA